MSQLNHTGSILPQNVSLEDEAYQAGPAQPVSQAEIDELLYGEERSSADRIARLKELRADLAARENADFGDRDPLSVLREIDLAISRLEQPIDAPEAMLDDDPLDHRETLAPDSDELQAIEEDDEDSLEEEELGGDAVLDPKEWDDKDGFDPNKGVA